MRRSERQIHDLEAIRALLDAETHLHLALCTEGAPYVLPMNYGYELMPWGALTLYLHCAPQGRKLELMERDARVGFAISRQERVESASSPCGWTARYRSLLGSGTLCVLDLVPQKRHALDVLMQHLGHEGPAVYDAAALEKVCVLRLNVEAYTCKSNLPQEEVAP